MRKKSSLAVEKKCLPIVARLLEFNLVDVNVRINSGMTAVHLAAYQIQSVNGRQNVKWESGDWPLFEPRYETIAVFGLLFRSARVDATFKNAAEKILAKAGSTIGPLEEVLRHPKGRDTTKNHRQVLSA